MAYKDAMVYDVFKDELGYRIDVFASYVDMEGNRPFRRYKYIRSEYPLNICKRIKELGLLGYKSANYFLGSNFDGLVETDYLKMIKLLLIAQKCKLLAKIYEEKEASEASVIKTYINYIDMNTGIDYLEMMGVLNGNDSLIEMLDLMGYVQMGLTEFRDNREVLDNKDLIILNREMIK